MGINIEHSRMIVRENVRPRMKSRVRHPLSNERIDDFVDIRTP